MSNKITEAKLWSTFVDELYIPGVYNVTPNVQMMGDEGYIKHIKVKNTGDSFPVQFDKYYVFEYFYKRMVIGLGFGNETNCNTENLSEFLDDLLGYCANRVNTQRLKELARDAEAMAEKYPGSSKEEWYKILQEKNTPNE
jgi:hypothetical protein